MKLGKRMAGLVAGLLLIPGATHAQQQPSAAQMPSMTHLRVDIVLTEYSGDKKISSLPYTMYVAASDSNHPSPQWESLRMGVRLPVAMNDQGTQFNYESVGTNLDCWASSEGDGRYRIDSKVDRSSIYSPEEGTSSGEQTRISGGRPILRHFSTGLDVALRDGETGEGVSATDPFNGHVLKVSVTIHVVK
jgi:hypothetical protein